ncbi:hypothetical protein E2C01_034898 [Portunus trituberculatus]|uniref:Uncharacterized protein n=1 Tax=Portunus trituberculatus TaxID=210409 RepID=A0A5B7F1S0_PORTR|nr:hypothetical protein [Portunus trituberculatus]
MPRMALRNSLFSGHLVLRPTWRLSQSLSGCLAKRIHAHSRGCASYQGTHTRFAQSWGSVFLHLSTNTARVYTSFFASTT